MIRYIYYFLICFALCIVFNASFITLIKTYKKTHRNKRHLKKTKNIIPTHQNRMKNTKLAKKSNELITIILSQRDAFHERQVIRETWANGHENIYFIVGKPCMVANPKTWTCDGKKGNIEYQKKQHEITEKIKKEKNIIIVDMVDVYRNLGEKLKLAYKWVYRKYGKKYVLKVDLDTFVRVSSVENIIKDRDKKYECIVGSIQQGSVNRKGKWAENKYKKDTYPPFPSGAGHIISPDLLEYINTHDFMVYQGEDTSLGIFFDESDIKVDFSVSKHITTHSGDCFNKNKFIIGHNINPSKVRQCYKHMDEFDTLDKYMPNRKKYLLFTSAGDKHNIHQWMGENRNYDIAVMYYGNKGFDLSVDMLVSSKDTKFPNLYKWIIEKKFDLTDVNQYNLVAIWDDDIVANVVDINNLFEEFDDNDASIYSPCHTRGNFPSLFKQKSNGLRKVDFVEMNAPIFKPEFLLSFMKNFDTNLKGFGTDIWFSQKCSNDCSIVVSDTTCVTNPKTRADGTREINKAQSEHDRSTYWKKVAKRKKINPNVPSSAYQKNIVKKQTLQKIINGDWKAIDLTPTNDLIHKLNKHIKKKLDEKLEGGTFKYNEKRQLYITLAKLENIKHICEIGFNGGHSALLWLHSNENAKVTMFDIWDHKYANKGLEFLKTTKQLKNVNKRLRIIKGSSLDTVKKYDGDLCDILSIDGDHSYTGALNDLINMRKHVRDDKSIILIDDTGCDKSFTWCIPVDKALEEVIEKKLYKLIYFVKSGGSGVSVLLKN